MTKIHWSAPWLEPWQPIGRAIDLAIREGLQTHEALNQFPAVGVTFVSHSFLSEGRAYEQFIYDTQTVPTRNNLHDFFNGVCWLTFPQTKKKLNQLQAEQLAIDGIKQVRGAVRDALTLFDENAAFLLAPQPLWDALVAKDWQRLFVELRPMWAEAQLILFGHALLEKLVSPRKGITAHVYCAQPAIKSIACLDAWMAEDISATRLASKPFAPLPVLGVPGWWLENEKLSFYEDILVFRPENKKIVKKLPL